MIGSLSLSRVLQRHNHSTGRKHFLLANNNSFEGAVFPEKFVLKKIMFTLFIVTVIIKESESSEAVRRRATFVESG